MINNLLFCMCAMGSIVYICYILLCLIFRYRFKLGQRLFLLLVSAAFYLLPLPLLHNFLKTVYITAKPYNICFLLSQNRKRWCLHRRKPSTQMKRDIYIFQSIPGLFLFLPEYGSYFLLYFLHGSL